MIIPHFMRPEWFWAILPALILAILLWRLRGRTGSWSKVISPALLPYLVDAQGEAKQRNFTPLLLVCWLIACVAAAGPSWQKIPQPVHQKQDALVLVLDLSYSMTAADLAPSRIDRARQKILDLLELRKEGQTGLVAYAGDAHIVTPLTDDTPTIANLLPALQPTIMPVPGSDPVAAISEAVSLLKSAGIRSGKILLMTDGIKASDTQEIVDLIDSSGHQLAVMGIGTSTGAPLPLPRGGFLKDESGAIVMPALNEADLRGLANKSAGRYRRMQLDNSDIDSLLASSTATMAEQTLALDRTADSWEDQGYFFILALLLPVLALFRRGWIVCLLPLLLLPSAPPAQAGIWDDLWLNRDQQGLRALQQEDSETAIQLFEDPQWSGTAAYRNGDYETAVENFSDGDSADAWYNRGNALARAGKLDEAIEAYRESLQRSPDQSDASENLALLEQLKQQQEQQQQGDGEQQEQDSQNSEQQQDQQQNSGQDSQQQSQQDQSGQPQDNNEPSQDPQDSSEQQAAAEDQARDEQGSEAETEDQDSSEAQQAENAAAENQQPMPPPDIQGAGQAMQENAEKDQALEQWLRRVPDDPSGLLREKFRYESRQRQQNGNTKNDNNYW